MTYTIRGLDPRPFAALFEAGDVTREAALAKVVTVESDRGYLCRVSLEDARVGETVLLAHHVSNDVAGPFRMAHAIYVRQGALAAEPSVDCVPAMLDSRTIGLRAFAGDGAMRRASLARPGEADGAIRELFSDPGIAYIHAHNAAYGCFLAAVERCHD
ncbi:MAG TPA: DUF1203 domain-containing protein [Qipengyuania sp.]|nr:DUF1203 domain-containing protein [Qipengyuania sp.]